MGNFILGCFYGLILIANLYCSFDKKNKIRYFNIFVSLLMIAVVFYKINKL